VAEIVVVPIATLAARPLVEIVAMLGEDESQVTVDVRSCVLPSLYVPVAVNCWVVPRPIEMSAGLTAMDCSTAGNTVSNAEFETIDPDPAVIVVEPVPQPLARPIASIVATVDNEEAQFTEVVTFCVEPSVKVPLAVNCWLVPSGIEALTGVIDNETSAAGDTVNVVCPDRPPEAAVIVVLPTACVLASPPEEMVAIFAADDVQTAVEVRF
jgi:hypothetical protein